MKKSVLLSHQNKFANLCPRIEDQRRTTGHLGKLISKMEGEREPESRIDKTRRGMYTRDPQISKAWPRQKTLEEVGALP
jgi:hypothetical protein